MPLPEGYLPREGDVLIFHATVRHKVEPVDEYVHVLKPGTDYSNMAIPVESIVGLHFRHFDVGDVVRSVGDLTGQTGEVVAVHEVMVWVKDGHGQMQTIAANELELAPVIAEPFVEPAPQAPPYESPAKAYLAEPAEAPEAMDQEKLDRIG